MKIICYFRRIKFGTISLSSKISYFFLTISLFVFHKKTFANCDYAKSVISKIESIHIAPKEKNADFSSYIFDNFIEYIDPRKKYFTSVELQQLEQYKATLFDDLNGACEFVNLTSNLYYDKIVRADSILNKINLTKLLDGHNSVRFGGLPTPRAASIKDLVSRWEKIIGYDVLYAVFDAYSTDGKLKEDSTNYYINTITKTVISREKCKLSSFISKDKEAFKAYVWDTFLDALATSYDPHTSYFSMSENNLFEQSLSKENYSYGVEFTENNNGEIVLYSVTPGSTAWKSSMLHPKDKVISIKINEKEISLECTSIYEIEKQLFANDVSQIELEVRKQSGKLVSIVLPKEKELVEDNVIKSFVLEVSDKKIGYISIPSFYTQWEGYEEAGCANDVAKEILKLNMNGIDGLCLDLRYNGGGSLYEAINFIGIFIDIGPLAVGIGKDTPPFLYKDMNRGVAYSGPLAVMVNGVSASASEFLAAALQDYNRAIIIGNTTFGKGTSQVVVPVLDNTEQTGFVKVTNGKLYRIKENSHQNKGVVPDITLVDVWDSYMPQESDYKNAFKNDSIVKKVNFIAQSSLPIAELNELSSQRLSKDSIYVASKKIVEKKIADEEKEVTLKLTVSDFQQFYTKQSNDIVNLYELSSYHSNKINVTNHKYDSSLLEMGNEDYKLTNESIKNSIATDIQIVESCHILIDYIQILNKK